MKNQLIAFCGLNCENCAEKATCEHLAPFKTNEEAKKNLGL